MDVDIRSSAESAVRLVGRPTSANGQFLVDRGASYENRTAGEILVRLDSADVPWGSLFLALLAGLLGSVGLVVAGMVTIWAVVLGLLVLGVGITLVAAHRHSSRLGWANGVTLARLVALSWITTLTASLTGPENDLVRVAAILLVAVVCLVLDGLDGHVARARGEESDFGARFDMETDAAMIMVLCVATGLQDSVGWWVLTIGLARYVYWLCSLRIASLNTPVAPSVLRKAVAVAQSVALLLCLVLGATGLGPTWVSSLIVAFSLAGLGWSFISVTLTQVRAVG